MKLQMSFAENLINLRKQKGWSQDDLADNLNLSRQAISKWENDTSKPDIDNIKKISKIFSVTIDDLLNNDVVKDKAVTLNVKKKEKKERTITIVKCMIIAVIILYIINVIFKFASLLIIVNGIQKYANLSNYHYVISTYDENSLKEKEECWFKDGVSKTINIIYEENNLEKIVTTVVNYNEKYGYIKNEEEKIDINYNEYIMFNKDFDKGAQLYSKLPGEVKSFSLLNILQRSFSNYNFNFEFGEERFVFYTNNAYLVLDKNSLLPVSQFYYNNSNNKTNMHSYKFEINKLENIEI